MVGRAFRSARGIVLMVTAGSIAVILTPILVVAETADPQKPVAAYGHDVMFDFDFNLFVVGLVVAALLTGGLVAAIAVRRAGNRLRRQIALRDTALDNMSQGLSMYNRNGEIILWNTRYTEIYKIPEGSLKVGQPLRDLIQQRIEKGNVFLVDPDEYIAKYVAAAAGQEETRGEYETKDGRVISIVTRPDGHSGWVVTHDDVTERAAAERALKQTGRFLDTVIENVPAPILVKDVKDFRYLLINRAGEEFAGVPRADIIGRTVDEVYAGASAEYIKALDRRLLETGQRLTADLHPMDTPGRGTRMVKSVRLPILGEHGKPQYLLAFIEDMTDRARAEARIEHMAMHDGLTDLPNRRACQMQLSEVVARAGQSNAKFALMCLDLDRFKDINDVFDSEVGDEILRLVSQRLRAAAGDAYVARLDGDEFQVIVTDGDQPAAASRVAERIYAVMSSDFIVKENRIRIGLSIGIAIFPGDGADAASLLGNASAALHRAKTGGRGSIRFFEAGMDRQLRERRSLAQDLDAAIERNELLLHYQPQARSDGAITGFESLVRWRHPRHGLISPETFIPIAEETGRIAAIGEWILRAACRETASWPKPLSIAVNLSAAQFRDDLPDLIHAVLTETGLPPRRLELEITEICPDRRSDQRIIDSAAPQTPGRARGHGRFRQRLRIVVEPAGFSIRQDQDRSPVRQRRRDRRAMCDDRSRGHRSRSRAWAPGARGGCGKPAAARVPDRRGLS